MNWFVTLVKFTFFPTWNILNSLWIIYSLNIWQKFPPIHLFHSYTIDKGVFRFKFSSWSSLDNLIFLFKSNDFIYIFIVTKKISIFNLYIWLYLLQSIHQPTSFLLSSFLDFFYFIFLSHFKIEVPIASVMVESSNDNNVTLLQNCLPCTC